MNLETIKQEISSYFFNHNMLSNRLPQVYILYKALQKIGEAPELVMGYLVNHTLSLYYIHFWVELKGEVQDIISESYNKTTHLLSSEVVLMRDLSIQILDTYINMDSFPIEKKRGDSFHACMNGLFFEDLYKTTTPIIHDKIVILYNKLDC